MNVDEIIKEIETYYFKAFSFSKRQIIQYLLDSKTAFEIAKFAETQSPCYNCSNRQRSDVKGYAVCCQGEHYFVKPRTKCEYVDPIINLDRGCS